MPRMGRNKTSVKTRKLTPEERAEIARQNGRKSKNRQEAYPKADPLPVVDNNEYDFLGEMYHPQAQYSPEVKLAAVTAYFTTGTVRGASRMTGVSKQTISEWKNKSNWWPLAYAKVKKDKQEELDATLTGMIDLAFEEAKDRILNGDETITKDGDIVRKKMSGKDLVTAGAIMVDKRAIIRGDPTSISASKNQSPQELLMQLGEQFQQIAKERIEKSVVKDVNPTTEPKKDGE